MSSTSGRLIGAGTARDGNARVKAVVSSAPGSARTDLTHAPSVQLLPIRGFRRTRPASAPVRAGRRVSLLFALAACVALGASSALAQGTITVPPDDPVYRDLDRLIDRGLITGTTVGQRPYSRLAIVSMAREAAAHIDSTVAGDVARALDRAALLHITALFDTAKTPTARGAVHMLRAEFLSTDLMTRPVPGNGLGFIEADLNTLTDGHFGKRYEAGRNVAVESEHRLELPWRIAIQVRPRLWAHEGGEAGSRGMSGSLLAGSVRGVRGNVALTVGREYTYWSPADDFGLLFSPNAPALDMVRLASDEPFHLPSLFRLLGPTSATLQVADVGRSVSNSHSVLVAYKVSAKPARALEFGATFENHFGGSGAGGTSALNRLIDLAPFVDVFRHHADSTDVVSDKLLGADARLRFESLAQATLFVEVALEDFDVHRLYSIFHEDGAYTFGLILPNLPLPSLSARVAFHTTGIRFYEHHLITNGIAARGFTLGDNLGHDAHGLSLKVRWDGVNGASVVATGDVEERRNDTFSGSYTNPDQTGLVFRRETVLPPERRARVVVQGRRKVGDRVTLEGSLGVERVANFAFSASSPGTHGLVAAGITFSP